MLISEVFPQVWSIFFGSTSLFTWVQVVKLDKLVVETHSPLMYVEKKVLSNCAHPPLHFIRRMPIDHLARRRKNLHI